MGKKFEFPVFTGAKAEFFTAAVDLRAFLAELNEVLIDEGFKDTVDANNPAKKGEWVNGGIDRRSGNMWEFDYAWSEYDGFVDFEVRWEAKLSEGPHSKLGSVLFVMDLVCRNLKEVELLEGNNKKVLQHGTYEFRNKLIYENSIYQKLEKNWIFQTFPGLKDVLVHHMYAKTLKSDTDYTMITLVKLIWGVIHKHFRPGEG